MLAIPALLALFATSASAINYLNTGVHCGTTADATLSDCQALVNDLSIWEGGESSSLLEALVRAEDSMDDGQHLQLFQRHLERGHSRGCLQRGVPRRLLVS